MTEQKVKFIGHHQSKKHPFDWGSDCKEPCFREAILLCFIVKEKFDLFGKAPNRDSECRVNYKAQQLPERGLASEVVLQRPVDLAWHSKHLFSRQAEPHWRFACLFVCSFYLLSADKSPWFNRTRHKPRLAFEWCSQLTHVDAAPYAFRVNNMTQPCHGLLLWLQRGFWQQQPRDALTEPQAPSLWSGCRALHSLHLTYSLNIQKGPFMQ